MKIIIRVMTANIWGNYFNNPVSVREDGLITVFDKYSPDVLGLQEVMDEWYKSKMFPQLAENYNLFGTEMFNSNIFVPMAARKEFKILAKGFEYFTDTPDASKSVDWAVLENNGKVFAVCNTHFWWMTGEEHDKIRVINAKQISALMKYLHERFNCPVFAFGDMNTTISSDVFKVYEENGIKHLYDIAEEKDDITSHHGDPIKDENGKFHGKTSDNDHTYSIDHIIALGDGFEVKEYRVVTDQEVLDATDHSPVYADIVL